MESFNLNHAKPGPVGINNGAISLTVSDGTGTEDAILIMQSQYRGHHFDGTGTGVSRANSGMTVPSQDGTISVSARIWDLMA